MNILSFDIEEWYLEKILHGGRAFRYQQFDDTFAKVLDELDRRGIKATFFCVGRLATDFPNVVREIAARGHEVGCHSNAHDFLTSLNPAQLKQDTCDAIHRLEDLVGATVSSYRAPAFSITPDNAWAVEILAECGIEQDASIFPAVRDFGGFPLFPQDTPCKISYKGAVLKEFPVTIMSILNKKVAFSGGGYFRALPYRLVKREMCRRDYNICYFHLADLIAVQKKMMSRAQFEDYFHEPGTLKNRFARYVKSNIGSGGSYDKLCLLMKSFPFTSIREADKQFDWDKAAAVDLSGK